ncbi:MAG: PAS domain S-box protein [Verrucomicrobiaceae bacterium]|nr:PAS domain S-box protein [Verrucomicrobiaceae bacterium]
MSVDRAQEPEPPNDREGQLSLLVENAPVALSMFDEQMRYLVANRLWIEEFGLQHVQPLVGRSQYEIFPGLHPGWRQVYDRALQGHIVRSEHDAISGQDGKPIIYRWEVRPWRRKGDASVGGLMVMCEKFSTDLAPAVISRPESSSETVLAEFLAESALPVVVLDFQGTILHANSAAAAASLARGIREGVTTFWEAFGDGRDDTALRHQTMAAVERLSYQTPPGGVQVVTAMPVEHGSEDSSHSVEMPARWVVSRAGRQETGRLVAVAMPGGSPFEPGPVDSEARREPSVPPGQSPTRPPSQGIPEAAMLIELQEDLNRAHQEAAVLREAEQAFAKRESRQRAVLESLPCGLLVLDERGTPIYQNENVVALLGRSIQRGESVEQWLMPACHGEDHKAAVARIWAQDIWSRQLKKVISLVRADGLVREIEFRPVTLPGGGVLINVTDVTDQCRIEEQLQSSEAKYRALLNETSAAVLLTDATGGVFDANPAAERLLARSKADLRRLLLGDWLEAESLAARKATLHLMHETGRHSGVLQVCLVMPDGRTAPVSMKLALVANSDGQPHSVIHLLEEDDPADRQIAHESREAADSSCEVPAKVQALNAPMTRPAVTVRYLLQTDPGGHIASWSADARDLFGFEAVEATGNWLHGLFRPSDPSGFYSELQACVTQPDAAVLWSFFGKNGRRGSARFFVKPSASGGMAVDLYEECATTDMPVPPAYAPTASAPRALLVKPSQLWPVADLDREKLLLSETHHRIKNHLQIISSMLNLQLNALADQGARSALRSSQNRVRSIAALHQHLYQLALGEGPGFDEFARGLAQRLRECYEVAEDQVTLQLHIEGGHLQQEWMMPLALILNETLSNAFEHAFPTGRKGSVMVRLTFNDGMGEFDVSDDGVGLPEAFDPSIAPGLGLKILGVFADQMRGELRLSATSPEGGTKFNLRFPMAYVDN